MEVKTVVARMVIELEVQTMGVEELMVMVLEIKAVLARRALTPEAEEPEMAMETAMGMVEAMLAFPARHFLPPFTDARDFRRW